MLKTLRKSRYKTYKFDFVFPRALESRHRVDFDPHETVKSGISVNLKVALSEIPVAVDNTKRQHSDFRIV